MQNGEIRFYKTGFCKHIEKMAVSGGKLASVPFHAMVAFIQTPQGRILYDTGYSKHFFDATKKFPELLYAMTTPVTLEKSASEIVEQDQIGPIDYVFISHFHADHIAGLKDFPNSQIICSKKALSLMQSKDHSRFYKTRKGLLPALLPSDIEQRAVFIEDLPKVVLSSEYMPFTEAYKFHDCFIVSLEGHALGQYGLIFKDYFLISDAVWDIRAITEDRMPNVLTRFIMDDYPAYLENLGKLKKLHENNPRLKIVPTHCNQTLKDLIDD